VTCGSDEVTNMLSSTKNSTNTVNSMLQSMDAWLCFTDPVQTLTRPYNAGIIRQAG